MQLKAIFPNLMRLCIDRGKLYHVLEFSFTPLKKALTQSEVVLGRLLRHRLPEQQVVLLQA